MMKYDPQQLQQKFEHWRELYRQQLAAQQHWLEAEALLAELEAYYQSPQWMVDHDKGLKLECSGEEHSILCEDSLWDMLADRDELAKRWRRLSLDAINNDREGQTNDRS